jgi:hypothetical protein
MLTSSGRLILVLQTVLSAIAAYHMLSLDLPPWVIKRINKICRAFLWHGSEDVKAGGGTVLSPGNKSVSQRIWEALEFTILSF